MEKELKDIKVKCFATDNGKKHQWWTDSLEKQQQDMQVVQVALVICDRSGLKKLVRI